MKKNTTDDRKSVTSTSKAAIIEQNIVDTLEINYMPYTMSVIVSRAIPEIDGFKPSHRKLLFTMYKMGLLTGNKIKSADVVGQTMRLNPHGDLAIYETMVRLTRGYDALLHPFVESKGNFGKHYSRDMASAASRYTEVKLDPICTEIFKDIDKETVSFIDNYNSTMKEPLLLPTTFPNLLVTPNLGIAVGMASNVSSFNLTEVCDTVIAYIKNPEIQLSKYLLAPDFSTGGQLIYSEKDIEAIYATGRGGFKLKAKYRYDQKNSCIEVYEIPYTTTLEAIIDKIVSLVKTGKIKDINDVRDETDINGLKITIDIKKSCNHELLMSRLFSLTPLCETFNCNFNILIDGRPRTMGIKEIIDEWLRFRIGCIKGQIGFDLRKKAERIHLLEGLSAVVLDIDKAIAIIRGTDEDAEVIPNLIKGFNIDRNQAEYICEIKLRNLNKAFLLSQINELDKLRKEIEDLKALLASENKIKQLIASQLKDISKKYGKPRRTEIIHEAHIEAIPEEAFIEDYSLKVFMTAQGYFKKISLISLRSSSDQNLKPGDSIVAEIDAQNKSEILFFSDRCCVYKAKLYDLPDTKASNLGEYLTNLLSLEEDEHILQMVVTTDYSGHMLFAYENGKMSKIPMSAYATKMNRKKLVNAFSDKSPLVSATHLIEDRELFVMRDDDKAFVFNTSALSPIASKSSSGVQVFTLKRRSKLSRVILPEQFVTEDLNYYQAQRLPSTGHFIKEKDKKENGLNYQLGL